ncbi:MAG: Hint domain-containing protein [Proteobacteria bacterium]|nr:Hint domain-containing protein [Pseudomonadota bacterium]
MVTGGNSIGASIVSTLELAANSSSGTLTGLGSQFINFGQVLVDAGAVWTLGGTNSLAAGTTLENDGTLTVLNGSFDSDGTVQNDGLIVIDPSTLTVGALIGTGTIEIAASSTLIVEGTVSAGETIIFTGLNGWLSLQPYQFAGLIDGFVAGETIDLAGVTDATSATIQDGNTLEVQRASHAAIQLRLDPNLNYTNTQFRISTASDLAQPDFITVEDLACFCAGTRIATPDGETPVEHLQIGDLVRTANGATARVRWLGRQTVSTVFADPLRVKPIRIKAGALDEATPVRDLLVSPDHALLVGDILVQAGALVNGISIVREIAVPEVIVYYHVETADHTLILAEGAPAETFIDNIDRLGFDNWTEHEALHPESAPIAEMDLPRAKSHRQVPRRIRELLMVRALTLSGQADRVA